MQWPRHPALWDPVCFTDQWTQSLLISSVPLTETGSTHSSHTHIYTNSSYTLTPHTHTHTHTNSSLTPHTHTLSHTLHTHTPSHTPHTLHKHTHSSHPHSHILFTHTHTASHTHTLTHSSHTHRHTPHTLTNTHPHILLTFTHTHIQSLQEHRHRKHGDPAGMLTHQAQGVCGNSPESHLRSVAGTSTHWEPLGLLELPENKGDSGGTQADPGRSRPNLTAL